jgi:uncharacterized protein with PhoU and TrkA domain
LNAWVEKIEERVNEIDRRLRKELKRMDKRCDERHINTMASMGAQAQGILNGSQNVAKLKR